MNISRTFLTQQFLMIQGRRIPVLLISNLRARRYILRLSPEGHARVTIPRGGTVPQALLFAYRNSEWLSQQLMQHSLHPKQRKEWKVGDMLFFRGDLTPIQAVNGAEGYVELGQEMIKVSSLLVDLRPALERHLWSLAAKELPPRVLECALAYGFPVRRISIRNQRSRWGSCSRHGNISLNWRLIQLPNSVRDYLIWHELSHLKEMNHSVRFWREVERVCPDYAKAEQWLKQHASLLR